MRGSLAAPPILAAIVVLLGLAVPVAHAAEAPTATTGAASEVTIPAVTLNASVNPHGSATTYKFEYGTSETYGSSIPASAESIGSGTKAVAVSQAIGKIEAETAYHFRVVATNAFGTSYGKDETFADFGSWTLESPPSPQAASTSYLSDVACPSSSACLAVGHSSANEGEGIAEAWNGEEWSLIGTGKGQSPVDVSCPTTTVCWAVGTQGAASEVLVERYEYEEWEEGEGEWWGEPFTAHKPIVPKGATNLRLNGISCTGSWECTAVGYYYAEGHNNALAERLASSGWSVQATPALTGAVLEDVSCASSASCTAVGYQVPKVKRSLLAERWDGSEWSALSAQAPPLSEGEEQREWEEEEEWEYGWLTSVSCASASDCLATGAYYDIESMQFPLALAYGGAEFSLTALPKLKQSSTLEAVSCASSTSCLATGHNSASGGTLALAYDGNEWATQAAITPEGKTAWLAGVSCAEAVACTTVGKSTGGGETATLAERVGGSWTLESPPSPKAASANYLSDVSCPSASVCLAVGHSSASEGESLGETWNGKAWSLIATGKGRTPIDVSCGSATVCWAVGTQGSTNEVLIERYEYEEWEEEGEWWGSPYTKYKPIVPEGATNLHLNAISCTSATECTAVGYYEKESKKRTIAERLTSSGWSVQTAPTLTSSAQLEDISCTSATECTAVGYQAPKTWHREPLAERWNGSEWSTLGVQAPPLSEEWEYEEEEEWEYGWLSSVSCASSTSCLATGSYLTIESEEFPFALAYGGTKFSLAALPELSKGSMLEAVSCAAPTSCLATGHNATGGGTLALLYDGTEWATQTSPTPEGKTAWLAGVACPEASVCMAVGKSSGGGETATLAERLELFPPTVTTEAATGVLPEGATLKATINPNGRTTSYQFEYGASTSYGNSAPTTAESVGSGTSAVAVSEPISGLKEGSTYHYRIVATGTKGTAVGKDETFTTETRPQTTITTPQPSYTSHESWPVEFKSDKPASSFKCGLDEGETPTKSCTSAYALPEHLEPGSHTFVVAAKDSEGLEDATPAKWTFDTGIYPPVKDPASKLTSPEEGHISAGSSYTSNSSPAGSDGYFTLKAAWGTAPEGGGVTGVTFQVKIYGWDEFRTIPAEDMLDAQGNPVSWPLHVSEESGETSPVFFDVANYEYKYAGELEWEPMKFRAVFDGGPNAAGASEPVSVSYSRWEAPNDAREAVGPANLDLVTGKYTVSRTDVSIPVPGSESNLEFTRVYNTAYSEKKGVLGGWEPSAPVEQEYEGEAWQKVVVRHQNKVLPFFEKECWDEEGETVPCGAECPKEFCEEWEAEGEIPEANWVEVLTNDGAGLSFDKVGESYVAPEEAKEFQLTKSGENFALADANGTHTVFTPISGAPTEYKASTVSFQATPTSARMVYEGTGSSLRLRMIIAPSAAAVSCSDVPEGSDYAPETAGCRSLAFNYSPLSKWIGGTSTAKRLESITYYDASGSGKGENVAEYSYEENIYGYGELTEEWDPRISPALRETYSYERELGDALLKTMRPPGEEPWEFEYYAGTVWAKLKSVSRASLLESPSTATTTVLYGVPLNGSGAPYDMNPEAVAEWGQSDFPVNATAIFPPTEVPDEPPNDYSQATVHYMDPDGYEVNTASPSPPGVEGDAISTTEIDMHGNVVRGLGAQARLEALQAEDPAERSHELDSHSEYSADGTEMLQSWGPLHQVRLGSGETKEARQHTTVKYDEGAPKLKEGETAPRLPTTEIAGAAIPGKKTDVDTRTTKTEYEWTLRRPAKQIVDPNGLNLISTTTYNEAGQVIQERQPSDTEGKKAGSTKTIYWTAGVNSEESKCGLKPAWAGLPCLSRPVAEPSPAEGNPKLPWTRFVKYSSLDQLEESYEEINGAIARKTTTTFDAAGRPLRTHQTGQGTEVPAIETTYNEDTGAPESQHFACEPKCEGIDTQEVKTTYDELGRPIEYFDGDGNKSETKYDLLGRPVYVSDGKGAQAIAYDEESGLPTEMIDSAAGTFKATYNADGQMTEQLLPNGLAQRVAYDPAGSATSLQYVKETYCSSACTWLSFDREDSIQGQVLREEGTLGTDSYAYDKAGRLTLAEETPSGEGCTTRSYAFDKDSNRTSKTTRAPEEGGGCDTSSEGSKQTYAYDSADRLVGEEIEYDDLGRITTLPARYAGPQQSWHVGGKTLSELKLESVPFYSEGDLVLNFPSWSARLECEMDSSGKLSGAEGIEESFELWGCELYEVKGGEKGKKLSCGPIEASISGYAGKASGMLIYLSSECLYGEMEMPISSFHHKFPDEEAKELPVETTGKASFGTNPVEISATSTWLLLGPQIGKSLSFEASGPVANEGELTTTYYVNDLTHSQSQGGVTNTYGLDASFRQRERVTTGGSEAGTSIYHYAGGSDSPAWTEDIKGEETSWTRNIGTLGGGLGAIENDEGEVTLQLANMHGDVVSTVEDDPEASAVLSKQRFDEFGNPLQSTSLLGGSAEYGWLGGKSRRTQLFSGVVQMGLRSYVPALGRFLTRDPVKGGSANPYDYADQDPVNTFDLTGMCTRHRCKVIKRLERDRRKLTRIFARTQRKLQALQRRTNINEEAAALPKAQKIVKQEFSHASPTFSRHQSWNNRCKSSYNATLARFSDWESIDKYKDAVFECGASVSSVWTTEENRRAKQEE